LSNVRLFQLKFRPTSSPFKRRADTANSAPTPLAKLVNRCQAVLVIDEAHATGVLGAKGRGRAAFLEGRENVVTVHT